MADLTKAKRKQVEELVYKVMDAIDKSGTNSGYYRELFAGMSDAKFLALMKKELPFRFHYKPTTVEPTMNDVKQGLDVMGVPLQEEIIEPFLFEDENGNGVETKEALVGYAPVKKVQQFATKKNKTATDIASRDMKGGRLTSNDKGATMSDREFESVATFGWSSTMKEFSGPRADDMTAKNIMYNTIATTGMVRQSDLPEDPANALSRNMLNAYLIGAHLNSNLTNTGTYTSYTLQQRRGNQISRA